MKYEVEQKFPVLDITAVQANLATLGTSLSPPRLEVDVYFAHPARNFAQTDEALRIRRTGEANCITYKGPKIDPTTKTRRELELPLGSGDESAGQWRLLLETLGFQPVGEVRKQRREARVDWEGRTVTVVLDDVERLGHFVELELISEESELDASRKCLASLAKRLELHDSERHGYLHMLLDL